MLLAGPAERGAIDMTLRARRQTTEPASWASFDGPGAVDEDGVSASLDEGVFTVCVPKAASERQRRITVT
jgi:HSP20 family molecular chaperone IbpA